MKLKIITDYLFRNCEEYIPLCEDAKKDKNFKGKCLSDVAPSSAEYEDFSVKYVGAVTNSSTDDFFYNVTDDFPCPEGYKRVRKGGKCKKIAVID